MGIFENYATEVVEKLDFAYKETPPVDAIEFLISSDFLNEDPTPFQRVAMKILYNLWQIYPPDKEEQQILDVLRDNWNIFIDIERTEPVTKLVLALGRRSTKSTLTSFITTFSIYTLICRGNPQKYYGIRDRHPIQVVHMAAAGDQAADVFSLTSDNIKKIALLRPYIDFDKDNSSELRMFSPYDLYLNEQIKQRNSLVPRGMPKEGTLPGSLQVSSYTTSAKTKRGKAIFTLIFSELAHFERTKTIGSSLEDEIISENPRSDYAVVKAMTPSVTDFGTDGKIIFESSPLEKGGQFYTEYCTAGGKEQENRLDPPSGYALLQLATWEARPTFTREQFDENFRADPQGAAMEYGAHFGNPSGSFISEQLIERIPVPNRPLVRYNPGEHRYIITLDAGGKAKAKKADTYAIGWGHAELLSGESRFTYYVDGMHGFDSELKFLGNGKYERIPVNPILVMEFLLQLCEDLGGVNYIYEICYDQWENQHAIAELQSLGLPAIETTFTNNYKSEFYSTFLELAQQDMIKMYGVDDGGWIYRWKQEMKFLQQKRNGAVVYYCHPANGPVQHDDFADITGNLVHRLSLRTDPTKQSIADNKRLGIVTHQRRKTPPPIKGPSLTGVRSLGSDRFRR